VVVPAVNLLPRPLRVSRAWVAGRVAVGGGLLTLTAWFVFFAALGVYYHQWWGLLLLAMTALAPLAVAELRKIGQARLLAADGEEVVGTLVAQEDLRMRDQHGVEHHVRRYKLLVDGVEVAHGAGARVDRPLFLDEAHTQALCVRSRSKPEVILVVRNDLKPFASTDAEHRAVRERIEQLREVRKLVSDIHSC
jgi:hypothetical protein